MWTRVWAVLWLVAVLLFGGVAQALTHVVQAGETLAHLAEYYYGRIQHERILVVANRLDLSGGTPLIPGMRLEIPTVSHTVIQPGDTWPTLAKRYLGATHRADMLALANGSNPWVAPEIGTRVLVPYNLAILGSGDDTVLSLAQKYLGDPRKAWALTRYNNLKGGRIEKGRVILIPMTDLALTQAAQKAASETDGTAQKATAQERQLQRQIADEIPALIADVRAGRYVDAVARGSRFLASGVLTRPQTALVQRQLLTSFAALDAVGAATEACSQWRKADPNARLDEVQLGPKLMAACSRSRP